LRAQCFRRARVEGDHQFAAKLAAGQQVMPWFGTEKGHGDGGFEGPSSLFAD